MQTVTSRENSSAVKSNRGSSSMLIGALVSLVVLLTVLAYSPVLFNFFVGDDFVHLIWLKEAIKNPELIWRNFHSNWLEVSTTRFYRPLISVFMVTDYLGWGVNGLGFHITNVLFHLTATVFLFFTANIFLNDARNDIAETKSSAGVPPPSTGAHREEIGDDSAVLNPTATHAVSKLHWLYPLSASLIFGLYPLHTEAVSWITGRVDAVVTAFYVAAFYFYLRWRKAGGAPWLIATITAFVFGLLSKEMALTLPPALMLYEVVLGPNALFKNAHSKSSTSSLTTSAINAVKKTAIFWLIVIIYFAVRRYALGTFVGGYDDSLFFIADVKHFLLSWLHGLRMFLIPLNKGLMDAHNIVTRGWEISLALTSILVATNLFLEKKLIRLFLFNGIFLAVCFAPVYKIFSISDDLQGARLAHVATVALSLMLAMAFIVPRKANSRVQSKTKSNEPGSASTNSADSRKDSAVIENRSVSKILASPELRMAVCACFSTACFAGLWTNNQAWSRAGQEANAIRSGLSKLYRGIKGDPQVLLLGLPDNFDGAYVCRNSLDGMTKTPQLERDIFHCLSINKYEPIIPFGFLKQSLFDSRDKVKIYFWDTGKKDFQPLSLEHGSPGKTLWSHRELADVVSMKEGKSELSADQSLTVLADESKNGKRPELILKIGNPSSFDVDFVVVHARDIDTTGGSNASLTTEGADLLYSNDISPEFELPNRTHAEFKPGEKSQTLVFPLRALPEYVLGGKSHDLMLKLPHQSKMAIDSIELAKADELIPRITFDNSGFMGTKGYLHLSQKDNKATVHVDASRIPDAASVVLEITRPNLLFETQNSAIESKVANEDLKPTATVSGDIQLTRDMFKGAGMYEARPWAVDGNGKKLGVAGDHIVITVDD